MRVLASRQGNFPTLLRGAELPLMACSAKWINICGSIAHMAMQEDLAKLEERDPEFFAYLQQTDADLLHFSLPPVDTEAEDTEAEGAEEEDASAQQMEVQLASSPCLLHI